MSLKSIDDFEDDDEREEDELDSTYAVVPLEKFEEAWQEYTESIKEKGKQSLYMVMSQAKPELIEENKFKIEVATETLKETFKAEQLYLAEKFGRLFGTTQFSIMVDVKELPEDERGKFLTTPKEKYDHMVKVNPHLKDLMDELDLDFDY
ncbi:MAG: hypothetical protein KDC92_05100 [Bacteroidetes bacterium]|nr:hypothetical protein [Bacteroidota bacterium]